MRIPGEAIWLVDACAGRQMLPVALPPEDLQRFCQELPEISVAQSALDHVTLEKWDPGEMSSVHCHLSCLPFACVNDN